MAFVFEGRSKGASLAVLRSAVVVFCLCGTPCAVELVATRRLCLRIHAVPAQKTLEGTRQLDRLRPDFEHHLYEERCNWSFA